MIQNERQYRVTKGQIAKLESALAHSRTVEGKVDPRIYRAMIAGIEDQTEELRQQLREYEELKSAHALRLRSADELAQTLVRARVARGYTQKDLAKKLRLRPQQIQKYEATGYQSASLKRVLEVMVALDLRLQAEIPLT
jgi:ribosome-binding protein aMBF1 (putative translation factor)